MVIVIINFKGTKIMSRWVCSCSRSDSRWGRVRSLRNKTARAYVRGVVIIMVGF